MKIQNIASALECSEGEILSLLEFYRLIDRKDTGVKTEEGHNIVNHKLSELSQFFCEGYQESCFAYDIDWHVDKLLKLKEFQAYVNATIEE